MKVNIISSLIELKDIQKTYRIGDSEYPVLKGIDLKIESGEFIALMGPSGSGKSTLLNIVGCLDRPTSGHFTLLGQDVSRTSDDELARLRREELGFIFQTFNLMPGLSALENVMLPMTFQSVPKDIREKKAKDLLKMVDLGTRLNHRPTELSGGQQQRVAIARSLANDPAVILADEPTGNLDQKTGKEVMQMLSKLHCEEGKTIVMVTHDNDIAKYAERSIKIKDGVIESTESNGRKVCNVPEESPGLITASAEHITHDKTKDKKHDNKDKTKRGN